MEQNARTDGDRRIVDLSLPVYDGMPVVPGTGREIRIERTATFDSEYNRTTSHLDLHSHLCSTHIDAPLHALRDAATVDTLSLADQLVGEAQVLDLRHVPPGHCVTVRDLELALEKQSEEVRPGAMLLVNTGWTDRTWGQPTFFREMVWFDSPAVGEWIAARRPRALVTDSYNDNWAKFFDSDWAGNHRPLLGNGIPMIEFCCNMHSLYGAEWDIIALPLKIVDCDAAPARVVAIEKRA